MRKKNLIKIGTLVIIFFNMLPTFSMEAHIPWLSVRGETAQESFINIVASLKSNNSDSESCFVKIQYRGANKKHPHFYSVSTYTYADTQGSYSLDMNLDFRLEKAVERSIINNKIKLPEGMSIQEYVNFCDFRITGLNFWIGDTNLILRSSRHYNVKTIFKLEEGTTHTSDYSFNLERDLISLEISTFEK
ncbi:hypothetical protein OAT67_01360 [Bacteriovoracaceae bacterium]|nr:hypothetical protein [Bacteriovoracaceae bacterium]